MGCTKRKLLAWVKETYGIEPDYPWADNNAVLRHQPSRKWFAVLLDVGKQKLGLSGEGNVDVVNLKCDPLLSGTNQCIVLFLCVYSFNIGSFMGHDAPCDRSP